MVGVGGDLDFFLNLACIPATRITLATVFSLQGMP